MAIFGGKKRALLTQLQQAGWRGAQERDTLLGELRQAEPSAHDVIPLVWSQDPAVRQVAVDLFLADPSSGAVKGLVEQLGSQPAHVRGYASRLIPRVDQDVLEKAVEDLLGDKSAARQRQGWELALEMSGEPGSRLRERAAREAPADLKVVAVQRLVSDGVRGRHVPLLLELSRDPDRRLAAAAVESLSKAQDKRVMGAMLQAFAHGDAASRAFARRWLQEQAKENPKALRVHLLELLGEGEDVTRRMAVELLLQTGPPAEILLQILLFSRDLVGWLRDRILETLRGLGDDVLQSAVELLTHPDEDVRTAALVLVQYFHDPRVVEPVCKLLQADDWWLRLTACDALAELGDERAVPSLVKALQDEECRWAAIDALARIGSRAALEPLSGLLKDPRPEVRLEVVQAFARFDDPRILPLLKMLASRDPSGEVRSRAVEVGRDLARRLGQAQETVTAASPAPDAEQLERPLDRLLAKVREEGCSDLHITIGEPPMVRRRGRLERMADMPALDARQAQRAIASIMEDRHRATLKEKGEVDFCHAIPEVGRYRVNVYRQRLGLCAAFRVIPGTPPTFAELHIPGRLTELLEYHQGLIVVSGPAASGKSTTLAAIVNLINETRPLHIITLEDPIEFVHPSKLALVNQREIGTHSGSFARALRASLREDPDVIMVGEMRDVETIRMALMAAETGHLVVATMHTTSAHQTIDRLVGSFPPDEQQQVRMGLSESLKYVVCQQLVPRKDGEGRVAVFEVLKGTLSVGKLIRDAKTFQIPGLMQIGRSVGMQTVDQALMGLVDARLIDGEEAWLRAEKPETFAPFCKPAFLREVEANA
ncbi:MAG: PilT/PilU family type 4a pilus ATPase [Pseudomonadota bacterium]